MEYAKGGDLKDYIKEREEVNEEVVWKIFKQIVDAIRYCHKQRILHHDLKLQNILLMEKIVPSDEYDELKKKNYIDNICIKIADFGLSTTFNDHNCFKGGSLAYLSPEVLNKIKNCDSTARDIWAIGIILFALCTGRLPWGKGATEDVKKNILKYDGTRQNFTEMINKIKKKQQKKQQRLKQKLTDNTNCETIDSNIVASGNEDGQLNEVDSEPPILINDEIQDILCRILRPSWHERATISLISQHSWLLKFDKHTHATVRSPKRSSPVQPFFNRSYQSTMYSPKVTSPKSASNLLNYREGENKGFRPPSSSFVRDRARSNEINAKKGNVYVVKNDVIDGNEVKIFNPRNTPDAGFVKSSNKMKSIATKSQLASRRSLSIPKISTKRVSPYKITSPSPHSGDIKSKSYTERLRRHKSLPDLFSVKNGINKSSSQEKLENMLEKWENKKQEATTPNKIKV
jgi:serine/threonine protein kinase